MTVFGPSHGPQLTTYNLQPTTDVVSYKLFIVSYEVWDSPNGSVLPVRVRDRYLSRLGSGLWRCSRYSLGVTT